MSAFFMAIVIANHFTSPMKWMRINKFSDVGQRTPFMLIGDKVKFDFQI